MASGTVSAAIEDYILANWTQTPLVFENEPTNTAGQPWPPATPAAFVNVAFTGNTYGQQSVGASVQAQNRWDEEGLILADVLVPIGQGSRGARTYAKQFCDLFRGQVLLSGSLEFLDASIGLGVKSDSYSGNYFAIPVDIEWRHMAA